MKVPISDKFLWSIYNTFEEADKLYEPFAMRTMKEAIYPDLYRFRRNLARKIGRRNFSQLIYYLKRKGYIKIENLEQKQGILLTRKGVEKVLKIKFKMIEKKKRPDGRWQMIIFDIPERKRNLRDLLRGNLYLLGYKMLQQSVWVSSYDVSKETEAILRQYSLDPYVKLFLIEEIEL